MAQQFEAAGVSSRGLPVLAGRGAAVVLVERIYAPIER
jgi:hypothetical protein